ncbi:hypothetical protein PU629_13400 [Pullulanibacillus sp. KACC 23026]|uniref:hypothetical protein n=1 Tax=Pullulanibacillus sp. KACC 23026 TaxID=3028315 RepID=UPI0023AF41FE|nr:hypothetical protein [Pullulanibacillus sp. KACC 23026]WEG11164.1 hypothetical protein PU629_13400 [Pullulanibacillus sp. KACC 23026]
MPRIEKVRISGLRYDKMKKRYDNLTFDFTNEAEPQHTLLTLVNGGGKGMLLQMLFQLVMPLTTWGKNGENHIDALFYNDKQQFIPYTFHVALEWRLDTDPCEWLTTGICVTAQKKYGQEEEESETEPQYFLYTSNYRKPTEWPLSALPFYNEEARQAIDYEDWETWLKNHKSDFHIYTKSKLTAYRQFLASYGIEYNEWRQMKDINRDEGGIEHYFKKGLDNFGLFHHLIIPEISQYLQDEQEENLVKIFKDNAIIAQKLPKLLKREATYRLLNEHLLPVQAVLDQGKEIEKALTEHHEYANYLYTGMRSLHQTYLLDQEKWNEEKKQTEQIRRDYQWQEQNLEYASEYREQLGKSEKLAELQKQWSDATEALAQLKNQRNHLEIDIARLDYEEVTRQLHPIEEQIRELENSQHGQEEKEEREQIEHQLKEHWKEIEAALKEDIEKYYYLKDSFDQEIHVLDNKIEQETRNSSQNLGKLNSFTEAIKVHNEQAIHMAQQFGPEINRNPEAVYNRTLRAKKKREEEETALTNERKALEAKKEDLGKRLGGIDQAIKQKVKELEGCQKRIAEQVESEEAFHKKWGHYFQLDQAYQPYKDHDWEAADQALTTEMAALDRALDNLKKDYWNHQLDTALVNDDYWIPNNDVRKLVEQLKESGVQAYYGTELIQQLSMDEQAEMKVHFPLLPYGVVILEQDLKQCQNQSIKELFLHAPVPLFIRERMTQTITYPFEMIQEIGFEMAFNEEKWTEWKATLSRQTEVYQTGIDQVQERIRQTNHLSQIMKELRSTSLEQLQTEEGGLQLEQTQLLQDQKTLSEEWATTLHRLEELEKALKEIRSDLDQLKQDGFTLKDWDTKHAVYLETQTKKEKAQEQQAQIEDKLRELKAAVQSKRKEWENWNNLYLKWEAQQIVDVNQLKDILNTIQFPVTEHHDPSGKPTFNPSLFQAVKPKMDRWHKLQDKINSLDADLAVLKTKYDTQLKVREEKLNALQQLDVNGSERELPNLPMAILKDQLQDTQSKSQKLSTQIIELDKTQSIIQGELNQILKRLGNLETTSLKMWQRAAEPWESLNLEEKRDEIAEKLTKLTEDIRTQEGFIQEAEQRQRELESQIQLLQSHISHLYELGETPEPLRQKLKSNARQVISEWVAKNKQVKEEKQGFERTFKERLKDLRNIIQSDQLDGPLRTQLNQLIPQLESDSILSSLSIVESVLSHIQMEQQQIKQDKQTAEQAQEVWVDRAVYRLVTILEMLKQMVNRMKVKNKEGHYFPLVEISRLNELVSKEEESYRRLLSEHFVQTIEKLIHDGTLIENLSDAEIKKYMSDSQLVLVGLRNQYPTLSIYKPQTTNAFLYEKPRRHHYTTWETLNKGSKIEAKGSGGQLLAARTMIMMMIMTFKRKQQDTNWSVLITDNPFGQAVSAHILDPIFSIAEILRFQWIVLAPPELIKLDVSRRFPVYWKLELQPNRQGEVVTEILQHGGRTFEEDYDLFSLDEL